MKFSGDVYSFVFGGEMGLGFHPYFAWIYCCCVG